MWLIIWDLHCRDQALTTTVSLWGNTMAKLYSDVSKPLFDIVLFSIKLSELVGVQGTV